LNNNKLKRFSWYCFDVEWVKAFENQQQKMKQNLMDGLTLCYFKKKPHVVALIELKYGNGAIGGESGIFKHIEDFKKYKDKKIFRQFDNLSNN
jgi:hypothetical protein